MKKIDREIKACQDLLAHYQGKKELVDDKCSLCKLTKKSKDGWNNCSLCLWERFEQTRCFYLIEELRLRRGICSYRRNIHFSKRWTQSRIKMLKRWIRLLKKERKSQ